jgi:putative membrane protein
MMMGFGLIWVILIVAVVAYLTGWRPENLNLGGPRQQRDERAPLDILKERYARGEIMKEEFERMRADLER